MKLIILVVPSGLLAAGISLWATGENTGGAVLVVETFVVGLIFWCVFPRRYEIYEDHIRIVLGGPFSSRTWFKDIEEIRTPGSGLLTINFVTRITTKYVEIARKKGMNVAITPDEPEIFVEQAHNALNEWRKQEGMVGGVERTGRYTTGRY